MRSYPTNSPEAAARLLAMALVADGQYSMNEIKTIDRLQASQRLGLAPEAIKAVIDGFCEDLLLAAGVDYKPYVKLISERPSAQTVVADRKAATAK